MNRDNKVDVAQPVAQSPEETKWTESQQPPPPQYAPPTQPPPYTQPAQAPYPMQQPVVQTHYNPAAPGQVVIIRQGQGEPENYLLHAILVTLFCCCPCGLVAIIYATKVRGQWSAGDTAGAQQSARSAKNWSIASLISGIILTFLWVLYLILYFTVLWDLFYNDDYYYNNYDNY